MGHLGTISRHIHRNLLLTRPPSLPHIETCYLRLLTRPPALLVLVMFMYVTQQLLSSCTKSNNRCEVRERKT